MVKVIGGAQEGEFKAVASGTLPNGKPVVVNSDGTVSVVGETPISQAVGSATTFESAITNFVSSAFDSNSNKLVISYRDQSNSLYGTAVVGTVSGTAISFGTPVVFFSGSTNATSTAFDSNSNKIVVSYRDSAASNNGKAVVGTVSGTSISFGTEAVFSSNTVATSAPVFDSNINKIVVVLSAMGKTTDHLVSLAKKCSKNPDLRDYDLLVSSGEQVSISLLSMALKDLGVDSVAYTGWQAGIKTNNSYSSARIININASKIKNDLKQKKLSL